MSQQVMHGRRPGPLGLEMPVVDEEGEARRGPMGLIAAPGKATEELRIRSLTFISDHGILLDHKSDWRDGGVRFDKPEWEASSGTARGNPVSQTMGTHIELEIEIEFVTRRRGRSLRGTLKGVDLDNRIEFEHSARFRRGVQTLRVKSAKPLPDQAQRLDLSVHWLIWGRDITAFGWLGAEGVQTLPVRTRHEVFVTMGYPSTTPAYPDITYRRMQHSVSKVAKAASPDPHAIVKHLMETFPEFSLGLNPANAWQLGDSGAGGDCRTIVRYVINILLMIGCPGKANCVLVYEKLRSGFPTHPLGTDGTWVKLDHEPVAGDFELVAELPPDTGRYGGLDRPALVHPNDKWKVVLFDRGGGQNNFEACLLFEHAGRTVFHGGGAKAFKTKEEVIRIFKSLSWAKLDRGDPMDPEDDKMVPVAGHDIKVY